MKQRIEAVVTALTAEGRGYILVVLLGLTLCTSEAMARNMVRVILAISFVAIIWKRSLLWELKPYWKFAMLLASVVAVQLFSAWHSGKFLEIVTSNLLWYNYNMFLPFALLLFVRKKRQLQYVWWSLVATVFVNDMYFFLQTWQGVLRPISLLKEMPLVAAMFYAIMLPSLFVATVRADTCRMRVIYAINWWLGMLAAFFSNTRGLWIALIVVTGLLVIYELRRVSLRRIIPVILLTIASVGIVTVAMPIQAQRIHSVIDRSHNQSFKERTYVYKAALEMAGDNLLIGVGMNNFGENYDAKYRPAEGTESLQHAHNIFLTVLAEEGIVGFVLFTGLCLYLLLWGWQRRYNQYGLAFMAATLCLLLYGLTDYLWLAYGAWRLYWVYMGVCLTGYEISQAER